MRGLRRSIIMKIAIGCDHGGLEHKNAIKAHLEERGFTVNDFGIKEAVSVDYPDIALPVADSVANGENDLGILPCEAKSHGKTGSRGQIVAFCKETNKALAIHAYQCGSCDFRGAAIREFLEK